MVPVTSESGGSRWAREVSPAPLDDDGPSWIETRPDPAPAADVTLAAREECAKLGAAVERMGPRYGSVFRLRFVEGCTETEIAAQLGLSVATVKTRTHRARLAARAALAA